MLCFFFLFTNTFVVDFDHLCQLSVLESVVLWNLAERMSK